MRAPEPAGAFGDEARPPFTCRHCWRPLAPPKWTGYCDAACRSAWRREAFRQHRNMGHSWAVSAQSVNYDERDERIYDAGNYYAQGGLD